MLPVSIIPKTINIDKDTIISTDVVKEISVFTDHNKDNIIIYVCATKRTRSKKYFYIGELYQ